MVRMFLDTVCRKLLFALLFVYASFSFSFAQNPIATENALTGNPKSEWDISGAGDLSIQGFATDISVNKGQTIRFKIEVTPAASYTIRIYRLGYYQGNGARLITNLGTFNGVSQPDGIGNSGTGLLDCSNWSESASWAVPATAVPGLYIAKLTKVSGGASSHIVFVVRDDASTADILVKTSDATWQAYNNYGGNSLYVGATSFPSGHAAKVSYNRPFLTRNGGGGGGAMEDWFMNAEYPLIRFLERNGYNLTYTTDVDMDRSTTAITPAKHKVIISSGHDEYWSLNERNKFESARAAGVHLAFFSGNEVYWKTRWEDNNRTLVCYKDGTLGENVCGTKCDPTSAWTGLWRDGAAYDAGKPENALTGQISWELVTTSITVPSAYKNLRFWRNTSVASLANGATATFPNGTLGYEADFEQYDNYYPLGRITLSSSVVNGNTHKLSLYRHSSGALVFGAGSVQWAWGLDNIHDRGSASPSVPMQQATVNLFADMGVQPTTLMSGLTLATASTDFTAPVVNITSPANGASLPANTPVTISGTASDAGGQLVGVYISVDGGTTWQTVNGSSSWTFSWTPTLPGPATIRVRGFDDSGNMGVPGAPGTPSNINVTITGSSPTCPCNIFPASVSPQLPLDNDGQPIEVGVKFRSSQAGYITGVKFWKGGASNNGTHIGHLWSSTGTKLAEANFSGETSSGWQTVSFSTPVAISANTTYVASYFSPSGYYASTNPYFTNSVVNGYLTALAGGGADGPNGVYVYTTTGAFPVSNFQSTNNWVDVVFTPTFTPDVTPPTVSITAPAAGNVSGIVNITVNAADNIAVAGVQFLLNGANLGSEVLVAPYSYSWNTTSVTNGTYTLTARARDLSGNTTTSASVVVTVNNVPDVTPPTVNLTSPAAGTVSGTINVTANAADNIAVAGVQFLLNGVTLGAEDVSSPYSISWNTFTTSNGTYTLTARARDAAGNTTTSAGVVVTVSNSNNLIVAMPLNEGSGTAAADISGNSHNGTLTNAPTWGTGRYGQGVNLDGTNDYISIADHANFTLDPAQSYTWSAWVRNNNFTEWSTVWSQTIDANNFFYFYAHTSGDPDGGPVTNGVSAYWWTNGGSNKIGAHSSNNVLTAGQWSHIAVTYDAGQPQNNRFTIYVNGVDVTVRTDVSSTGTITTINPTNTRIGSNQPFGEYINGSVDEVRYYRRLLSSAEVQTDMNTPLGNDVTNPTVNITAPAAGNVSATINVDATATDNVGVAGVQFLLDGVNLGAEDLTAPYSVSWNTTTATNGNHTLTARARDAAGNTTTSAGVVVNVNNDTQAPTVNLTEPAAGTVVATINVSANAADNVGVAGVQFLLDGNNLGAEDVTAPYTISWNTTTIADGNHTLTARARDAAGNTTTSSSVIVNVLNNPPDTQFPAVNITSPAAGNVAGTISVDATASDNVGVIGVQFLLNGVNLGAEDLSAPYAVSWNTLTSANGSYTLTARARDAAGNTTTSAGVVVTVNNDTQAPTVNLTEPAAGTALGTINVSANAADNVGVAGVQFLLDGNNLGAEDLIAPYTLSWNTTTITDGNHTLTARARDAAGNTTTSAAVVVNVQNTPLDTQFPTVNITAPAAGNVAATINVDATASDNVGVVGVQFLLDGINLGAEDVAAPYSVSWVTTGATNGSHVLTARARDAAGNITTSTPVNVTVNNTNLVAAYGFNENTGTTATDNSGNNNNGTLTNGPAWSASGRYGSAILFDGTNDYININDANSLDLTNGMTLEAWVNPSNLTGFKTVICKDRTTSNYTYTLAANNNTTNVNNQRPNSRIRIGSNNRTVTGTTKLTLNTWTHIASTYDGTTMRLYINGVQVSTFATTGNITVTTDPLRIGGTTALTAQYFAGLIDEVRIYNRALTQAEIQTDMNTPIAPDVTNPVVTITTPAAGDVSGTINVSANASDNIGVSGVQFLLDGVNLGTEDLTAPYSVSWNTTTATNGNHTLTARARDAAGNTTTSAGVVVTVNNDTQVPTVSLTEPVAGTVLGTINVSANAADNVGVAGVQFLLDGNNLGAEDLAAPYTISWNTTTIADGNHTLTARARDAAGNITTSSSVIVNVLNNPPDTQFPAVNITAPAAGNVTGTINVTANATDNVGVVGVQFLLNGANLSTEDLVAPYSISWNTLTSANGSYTLTARARDAAGNTTTSAGVVVTVNNDTQAPTVNITEPAAGTVLGTINVSANAADNVGIAGVQFLLDGNNLGAEDLIAPYTVAWNTTTITDGSHTLTARARDAAGNITTSTGVVVTVANDTQFPTVNITAPAAGNVTGTINVTANATDNVGVVGVQFLLNGSNLGAEDISSPFSVSWNTTTVPNGNYTLTARARDASGNTTTSAAVNVIVNNNTNLIVSMNLNEGTGTNAADISGNSHNGTLINAPIWGTGRYGQGVNFDGTNDYINIADHNNFTLDPAQSYTWSAWVRSNNFTEWSTIWSQTLDFNNFFYFYAHTSSDPDGGPVTNGISAYWWNNGGSSKIGVHSSNNVLTAGQWSYVAITYDASQPQNNRFTIYVNGVDVTVRTDVSSTGTITSINPGNIRIGSNQPFGEYINGSVDEVRFYRRLLSTAEVQTDMNSPIATTIVPIVSPANGAAGVAISTAVTVVFNLAMDATTINSSTIELRNSLNVLVPASVTYNATTRTATLTPSAALSNSTLYSAKVKGGTTGVKDLAGNTMVTDLNWSFTTVDPPLLAPADGPGGPILVVSTSSNPFSRYAVEILRAEGLNHFAAADVSTLTATLLNNYDVVVLGEMTVTAAQVTLLTNWVNAGGTLIAFKPSALLNPLMGINTASGTLTDRYLLVNTSAGPGFGIVNQTIQFHGAANLHTLNGATSLATLYSAASTATSNPAVTTRNVGANGGRAVAFTYDLARSIIYTRQGNPAWAGQKRDGQSGPIRSDDMFFPDWVDFNKIAIPQADEQQRLLANIILQGNLHRKPLPRFWYLPRDLKAAVVMTGDDHAVNGTVSRFNQYLTMGPNTANDIADWNAVRATSYIYPNTPITDAQSAAFQAQGFEIALHPTTNCANYTLSSLQAVFTDQLTQLAGNFPSLAAPVTNRSHCLVWSDWSSTPKVELQNGIRLDVTYYYWPEAWMANLPGMFTGSGIPMRYADTDGSLIDVYQATTQMTDETNMNYSAFSNAVLDKAVGPEGYYGVFTTNMHTDQSTHAGSNAIVASAQARQIPVISAKQMLNWLDGRNNSFFSNMTWSNNLLSFNIMARSGARNLKAMLPIYSETGQLVSITMNGAPVTFTTQTIKGILYAFFPAALGNNAYVADYSGSLLRTMEQVVTSSETIREKPTESSPDLSAEKLEVIVIPNPSSNYFNLYINSNAITPVSIRIFDVFGQSVEKHEKITAGSNLRIGQSLKGGTYFAEVTQGDQRKVVKMIKVN
ncbi:MAG TPA: Ig-like domain-containing protein [Chitinophagaceae bacterium]